MRTFSLAAALFLVSLAALAASPPPGQEAYHGFDLDRLAEANAVLVTLRTQHGEAQGKVAFDAWLAERHLTRAAYDASWAAWWERFRADATGQLEARFTRINAEYSQRLNFAEAKDRRQETREGVTLDTYARIAVALTRLPGSDTEKVLHQYGVRDRAHWQKVNEAWGQAMKEDTSFALVQQYGALYQKYAGPQFTAEQDAVTANALARHQAAPSAAPAATPHAGSQDLVARLAAADPRTRWEAARALARDCSLWIGPGRRAPGDPRAARCARETLEGKLLPAILDAIDHFDDDTIAYGTNMLDFLPELGLESDSAKLAVGRALNRAAARLTVLEDAFAPIRDKAVPERIVLRAKIDGYSAAVRDLRRALDGWDRR